MPVTKPNPLTKPDRRTAAGLFNFNAMYSYKGVRLALRRNSPRKRFLWHSKYNAGTEPETAANGILRACKDYSMRQVKATKRIGTGEMAIEGAIDKDANFWLISPRLSFSSGMVLCTVEFIMLNRLDNLDEAKDVLYRIAENRGLVWKQ